MPDRVRSAGARYAGSLLSVAAGLALVAAGGIGWLHEREPARSVPQARPSQVAAPAAARVIHHPVAGAPRRIRIPALAVDAPVLPVSAPGGTLVPPSDPRELGWWVGSARPGSSRGRTLVAGHTVHLGGGALDHLDRVHRDDLIVITTARGRLRYRVERVHVYAKGAVTRDARRLFAQSGPPRLVVVTCSGWDGVRYLSNTVVTARIVTARHAPSRRPS